MERTQKYVYKVYTTKSFSKAAKELYISQPSLSSMVKKLEKELGFLIFDRSENPVELTPEGRIYIEYLEELMQNEKEMLHKISRLSAADGGLLSVGGSDYLSNVLLPMACGEFHRRFPEATVKIDMNSGSSSGSIFNKLENETLDVIISHRCDKTRFTGEILFDDPFVIAVRKDTPGAEEIAGYAVSRDELLSEKDIQKREITDYTLFKNIDFLRYGKSGSTWSHMYELLEHCRFSLCQVNNSQRFDVHYDMMLYGNGAVVTSKFLISQRPEKSDEVLYFPTGVHRQAMVVYKKNRRLSASAKEFIGITKEILNSNLIRW